MKIFDVKIREVTETITTYRVHANSADEAEGKAFNGEYQEILDVSIQDSERYEEGVEDCVTCAECGEYVEEGETCTCEEEDEDTD